MKLYYIALPGLGLPGCQYGKNEKEALNQFKKHNELKKMPKGYVIWECDQEE